jgi:hypothetical protein
MQEEILALGQVGLEPVIRARKACALPPDNQVHATTFYFQKQPTQSQKQCNFRKIICTVDTPTRDKIHQHYGEADM